MMGMKYRNTLNEILIITGCRKSFKHSGWGSEFTEST